MSFCSRVSSFLGPTLKRTRWDYPYSQTLLGRWFSSHTKKISEEVEPDSENAKEKLSKEDLRVLDVPTNCTGCGAVFQVENPSQPGYLPSSVAMDKLFFICQRCFHLKHYNKNVSLTYDHSKRVENTQKYIDMLKKIQEKNAVIIKIVDMMDVHGTLIPKFSSIVGNHPVILIGNKYDILPKDTHYNRVRTWLLHTAIRSEVGTVRDVFLMNSNGHNKETWGRLIALLLSPGIVQRDVYVVGVANVGKSTFITNLLKRLLQSKKEKLLKKNHGNMGFEDELGEPEKDKEEIPRKNLVSKKVEAVPVVHELAGSPQDEEFTNFLKTISKNQPESSPSQDDFDAHEDDDEPIETLEQIEALQENLPKPTISPFPGTTLSFLSVPIPTKKNKSRHLIDTPGLFNPKQISHLLPPDDGLKLVPNKRFLPFTARLTPHRVLFIGSMVRFDIIGQGRMESYITCFVPPSVKIHPTAKDGADLVFSKQAGKILTPPSHEQDVERCRPTELFTFNVSPPWTIAQKTAHAEIAVPGLGFFCISGRSAPYKIEVRVPKGITPVFSSHPMMPYEAQKVFSPI